MGGSALKSQPSLGRDSQLYILPRLIWCLDSHVDQVSELQSLIARGTHPTVRGRRIYELLHSHPRAATLSRREAQTLAV